MATSAPYRSLTRADPWVPAAFRTSHHLYLARQVFARDRVRLALAVKAAAKGNVELKESGELKVEQPKRVKRVLRAARSAVSSSGQVDFEQQNERELHLVVDILPEALRATLREHPEYTQVSSPRISTGCYRSRAICETVLTPHVVRLLVPRISSLWRSSSTSGEFLSPGSRLGTSN
jgi:hypothetical protein